MIKVKLNIEGMHCGSCATGIQMLLKDLEGVTSVSASFEDKGGEVEFDEARIKLEDILKAIEELGYKATQQS